jgi:hypothetical protein
MKAVSNLKDHMVILILNLRTFIITFRQMQSRSRETKLKERKKALRGVNKSMWYVILYLLSACAIMSLPFTLMQMTEQKKNSRPLHQTRLLLSLLLKKWA